MTLITNTLKVRKYSNYVGVSSKERFTDIKVPNSTESKFVACNGFFTAIPWKATGGGHLIVEKMDNYKKFKHDDPMIKGHTAPIVDFDFNPFIDNLIATASEDGSVGLWTIPIDGLTSDLKIPSAMMYGHSRKLTHVTFNPSAENVLASAAIDQELKIWDAYRGKEYLTISGLIGQPTCLEWNYDGSLIASTDKERSLHVLDPRSGKSALLASNAHEGQKQIKWCWLGESNRVLTSGLNSNMMKEVCIWDSKDLSQPLIRKKVDKNIEVSDPFFDSNNNLVYLAVKGEQKVNIWELVNDDEMIYQISTYKGESNIRGFSFLPKRFVDVMSSELMKAVRLTDKFWEYVSFRLPKKKGAFVSSLYTNWPNGSFSKTFKQWAEGESAPPPHIDITADLSSTIKMRIFDGSLAVDSVEETKSSTHEVVSVSASSTNDTPVSSHTVHTPVSIQTSVVNNDEIERLKASYEKQIAELKSQIENSAKAHKEENNITEKNKVEIEKLKSENETLKAELNSLRSSMTSLNKNNSELDRDAPVLQNSSQAKFPVIDIKKGLDKLVPRKSTWKERNVLRDGHFHALKD